MPGLAVALGLVLAGVLLGVCLVAARRPRGRAPRVDYRPTGPVIRGPDRYTSAVEQSIRDRARARLGRG